jgi:hypothetical protein
MMECVLGRAKQHTGCRRAGAIIGFREKRPCRIAHEQFSVANVTGEHGIAGVASLRPYLEGRYARLHCAGGETGAQAMRREAGRV